MSWPRRSSTNEAEALSGLRLCPRTGAMCMSDEHIPVRHETYVALKRIREDESWQTFDKVIQQLIEYRFKGRYDFGGVY